MRPSTRWVATSHILGAELQALAVRARHAARLGLPWRGHSAGGDERVTYHSPCTGVSWSRSATGRRVTDSFSDFAVAVDERTESDGVALAGLKGAQLLQYERDETAARRPPPGLRARFHDGLAGSSELVDDGPFEAMRLRYF